MQKIENLLRDLGQVIATRTKRKIFGHFPKKKEPQDEQS